MTDQDFKRLLEKVDAVGKIFIELTEERDQWKKMYYDLKYSADNSVKTARESTWLQMVDNSQG